MEVSEAGSAQKRRVRAMFDAVASRYDLLNHLLSLGVDRRWRRRTVHALDLARGNRLLDLCAGTGDLGLQALRQHPGIQVVGVDLSREMLVHGINKRNSAAYEFVQGDMEQLPLADASVDAACVGFGIRNVASLPAALRETARVLRPGGVFVILEFTTPPCRLFRSLFHLYFHHVLPRIGAWVSGEGTAYSYLPESVSHFPAPGALAEMAGKAGFRTVEWTLLTGGIAAVHRCRR